MSPEKKEPFEQLLKSHLSASLSQPPAEPCPDENWMAAYLEGSQSEHFKKAFERHLLQCDRCQAEMAMLLKTSVTDAHSIPSAVTAESSPRSNPLALLFDWTRAAAFRPVFAILLVSAVTGILGYRLLRDDRILQQRSMDTSESAAGRSSASSEADQPPASPPVNDQKSQEQKPSLKSDPSPVPRRAAQDRLEAERDSLSEPGDLRNREKSSSRDGEMKDAFAAEPPSSVPAESSRDAGAGLKRRDVAMAPQSLPEPSQKESLSAAVVDRQNSKLETKADEASAKPKNQVMPAAPLPGVRSVVGALSEGRTEQDKVATAEETRAAGASEKKQVLTKSARQAAAFEGNETSAVSRIEVSGKRFDLIDGVWRDSSILPNEASSTQVSVNSPEFEKVRKQLAPYQPVVSRPEDVFIKLHNRVYRIQKAPK